MSDQTNKQSAAVGIILAQIDAIEEEPANLSNEEYAQLCVATTRLRVITTLLSLRHEGAPLEQALHRSAESFSDTQPMTIPTPPLMYGQQGKEQERHLNPQDARERNPDDLFGFGFSQRRPT